MGLEPVPDEYCPRCLGLVEPGSECLRCKRERHEWLGAPLLFGPPVAFIVLAFVMGYTTGTVLEYIMYSIIGGAVWLTACSLYVFVLSDRKIWRWPAEWPRPSEWRLPWRR